MRFFVRTRRYRWRSGSTAVDKCNDQQNDGERGQDFDEYCNMIHMIQCDIVHSAMLSAIFSLLLYSPEQ